MAWNETTREKYKRSSERYESDLTDGEWRVIEPLLLAPSKLDRRRVALRAVFDAIQVYAADVQDRDGAPEHSGEARPRAGPGDRPKTQGNQRLHRTLSPGVVERTFAWLSRCRCLAKDVERTLESYLAWVQLAACRFLMRRVAREITLSIIII